MIHMSSSNFFNRRNSWPLLSSSEDGKSTTVQRSGLSCLLSNSLESMSRIMLLKLWLLVVLRFDKGTTFVVTFIDDDRYKSDAGDDGYNFCCGVFQRWIQLFSCFLSTMVQLLLVWQH
ncbi:hypothetical protein Droror1_Dr00005967 [Drosera rotundifolia]